MGSKYGDHSLPNSLDLQAHYRSRRQGPDLVDQLLSGTRRLSNDLAETGSEFLLSSSQRLSSFTQWFSASPREQIKASSRSNTVTQEDFDIPQSMRSDSAWEAVVLMLDEIDSSQRPTHAG